MEVINYTEAVLCCNESDYELISWTFFEKGAEGIEEVRNYKKVPGGIEEIERTDGKLSFKIYATDLTKERLETMRQEVLTELSLSEDALVIESFEEKPQENWQENWKENFKPLPIGEKLIVLPPWEKNETDRMEISINPGMGFGTGYHESTRLALENLEWLAANYPLNKGLDVGIGSGILAIAASHLGAKHTLGIDIDLDALKEVPDNVKNSGIDSSTVSVVEQDIKELDDNFDFILANIVAEILIPLKDDMIRLLAPGGKLMLSGVIDHLRDELFAKFDRELTLVREVTHGEWHSFIFSKE